MPNVSGQTPARAHLRIALVAGGLGQGGAEKQLLYMANALRARSVDVRCYCLTRGDHHEAAFVAAGVAPIWIGQQSAPPARVVHLSRHLRAFRPHVVQAGHFFANLYAALGARLCGASSLGAIRNDGLFEMRENGGWGPYLMRWPTMLMANSHAGAEHARRYRRCPSDVVVVPNVIDLAGADAASSELDLRVGAEVGMIALAVGRLVPAKRFDVFLSALALARRSVPSLTAVVVGSGPEQQDLTVMAEALGLGPPVVRFLGARPDVPALMRQADCLVSCSDHEGFPNVLLEAMAAGLPAIATPAGDVARVLVPGETGLLVERGDARHIAEALVQLATQSELRQRMGRAARRRVERHYAGADLADQLLEVYLEARRRDGRTLRQATVENPSPTATW